MSRNTRFIQIQIRSNSGHDVRAVPSSAAATRPRDPLRRGGALLFYHGQNAINNPMHYGGDVKSGVKYLVPWHSLAETAETSLPWQKFMKVALIWVSPSLASPEVRSDIIYKAWKPPVFHSTLRASRERERRERQKMNKNDPYRTAVRLRLGWPWYVSQKTLRDEYVERSNQEPTTGVCSFGRNTGVMWGCFVMRFDSLMLTASCREPCSPGFVSGSPNNFSDARLNSGSCYLTSSLAKLNHAGTGDRVGTLFGDVWWELLYI